MTIVYNGHFFSTDGVMQLHTTICISNSDLSAYLNRFYILISIVTPDNLVRLNPLLLIHKTVVRHAKKTFRILIRSETEIINRWINWAGNRAEPCFYIKHRITGICKLNNKKPTN